MHQPCDFITDAPRSEVHGGQKQSVMEMEMTANLGNLDRVARVILGLALFIAPLLNVPAIWSGSILAYVSMAAGVVFVATAFFRFCPLYRLLGVSTCKL